MKNLSLAVVGFAALASAKQPLSARLDEENWNHSRHVLKTTIVEGTFFQDDSDKEKEEDSLWWWNGWYKFNSNLKYGVKWGFDTTGGAGYYVEPTAKLGTWFLFDFFLDNEIAEWYWNAFKSRFELFSFVPLLLSLRFPPNPTHGDVLQDAKYCIAMDWWLSWLQLTTTSIQSAKVCQQSLIQLADSEKIEPLCAYDPEYAIDGQYTDEFLSINGWTRFFDLADDPWADIDNNWYGTHSFFTEFLDEADHFCFQYSATDMIDFTT